MRASRAAYASEMIQRISIAVSRPPAAISIAVWKPSECTSIFGQWKWGRFIEHKEALDVPTEATATCLRALKP